MKEALKFQEVRLAERKQDNKERINKEKCNKRQK
jgi:hypothetical protein